MSMVELGTTSARDPKQFWNYRNHGAMNTTQAMPTFEPSGIMRAIGVIETIEAMETMTPARDPKQGKYVDLDLILMGIDGFSIRMG